MKTRETAKIGTHSQTILVLWSDKVHKVGDIILAMPYQDFDSRHWSERRRKTCNGWQQYKVDGISPILFVSRW